MKLLKSLFLIALVSMMYSCSNNIMNDEDPASQLKAEEQAQVPTQEFVKSDHIAGYLDADAEVLYLMPQYKDMTLQRLGAVAKGNGVYQIETKPMQDKPTVTQTFSIIAVKDRGMIYNLATVKPEETALNTADDLEIGDPIPVDIRVYSEAKCTEVWGRQVSDCRMLSGGNSVKVWRWTYSNCQVGEDICIEEKTIVRTTIVYPNSSCTPPGATPTYVKKYSCATGL